MTTYAGWWQVPAHLLPATALGELEYPRAPEGEPAAWVEVRENWQGKQDAVALYDARACPPTKATARQLAAATAAHPGAARRRVCGDCGARCQRPLPPLSQQDPRRLCPTCRHVALLRRRQAQLAASRMACAERAHQLLGWHDAAVLQVDLTVPPPTPAGRKRPPTAARVRAVDLDGTRLVDLVVRLVGPRAHHVPDGAVSREDAAPAIHQALDGRRLIVWHEPDLQHLREVAPDLNRAVQFRFLNLYGFERERVAVLWWLATQWRGQLDPHTRTLIACLPPGTPDRLLLLLRRIAATLPAPPGGGGGAAESTSTDGYTDLGDVPAGLDPEAPELPNGGVQIGRFTGTPYDGIQLNIHQHATTRAQAYLTPAAAQRMAAMLTAAAGNPDHAADLLAMAVRLATSSEGR